MGAVWGTGGVSLRGARCQGEDAAWGRAEARWVRLFLSWARFWGRKRHWKRRARPEGNEGAPLKGRGSLRGRGFLPEVRGAALLGPLSDTSGDALPAGRPGDGGGPRVEAAGAAPAHGGRRRPAHPLPLLALLQRAPAVRGARRPAPVRAREGRDRAGRLRVVVGSLGLEGPAHGCAGRGGCGAGAGAGGDQGVAVRPGGSEVGP